MGMKLRAKLPKSNGLADLTDKLASEPGQRVVFVADCRVDDIVYHVENDTSTVILRMDVVEAFDGQDAVNLQGMIRAAHKARTGLPRLPYEPGAKEIPGQQDMGWNDDIPSPSESASDAISGETQDVPGEVAVPAAAFAEPVEPMGFADEVVPAEATPIRGRRRRANGE